jgi:gliding motility-associated-like protein
MRYPLLLPVLFISSCVAGQGFYNRGAVVSVAPETIFILPDSVVNTGTLINDGELTISGAWLNSGTYDPGGGQLNFNSNQTQTINHSDQSVGKLLVSGGGRKQFLANITILSELNLQDGILVSGNGAKIIIQEATAVSGGSDNAHIQGPVQRSGAGNWLFPLGNGSIYLPVEIHNVIDAAASATVILNDMPSAGDPAPLFERFSENRFWELVAEGQLSGSSITLPLRDESSLSEHLVVAGADALHGPYSSLGQSSSDGTPDHGSITSDGAPLFRYLTIGALASDQPIEVFNAVSGNNDGKNDLFRISNIEFYPDNKVTIFNRWGDKVFQVRGYHNVTNHFNGASGSTGKPLPPGTYFYEIDPGDGLPLTRGFLVIR